jgi:hypothetical protein
VLAARGFPSVPACSRRGWNRKSTGSTWRGGLISFESIVDTEDYNHPFGHFAPNLLLHTDLPELAASMVPRRVVLAGAVDGAGRGMVPEARLLAASWEQEA